MRNKAQVAVLLLALLLGILPFVVQSSYVAASTVTGLDAGHTERADYSHFFGVSSDGEGQFVREYYIEYGTTIDYGTESYHQSGWYHNREITVYDLEPGTLYHYRAREKKLGEGDYAAGPDHTFTTSAATNLLLRPSGPGAYTELPQASGEPHWQQVNDNNVSTWIGKYYPYWNTTFSRDLFTFTVPSPIYFQKVTLTLTMSSPWGYQEFRPLLYHPSHGLYQVDERTIYPEYYNVVYSWTLDTNPFTGGAWSDGFVTDMQFGLSMRDEGQLGTFTCSEVGMRLDFVSYSRELKLYVDDMDDEADSTVMLAPVPDNTNNWKWTPNPYLIYIKIGAAN